jgi:hypothetical protein
VIGAVAMPVAQRDKPAPSADHPRGLPRERTGARPRWGAALAVAALSLSPAAARAQDPAADAQRAFTRGVAALQASHFADAVVAFQQSYRLRPVPTVLYDLALAYRALGQNLEAIDAFQRYLHDAGGGVAAGRAAAIRQALVELRGACGVVALAVSPEGAAVTVDGRAPLYGPSGRDLLVNPGERVVHVEAPGRVAQDRLVRVAAGGREELTVSLAPAVERPAPVAPTTACVAGVQVRCACPGGTSSVQRCADDGAGFGVCECPQLPAAPPTREAVWYGWQILIIDGAASALSLLSLTGNEVPSYVAAGAIALGPPIVHWAHRETGSGFASLAVRVLVPGFGAVIGLIADRNVGTTVYALTGLGYLTALTVDVALFARTTREVRRPVAYRVRPVGAVAPLPGGAMLTLGAAF